MRRATCNTDRGTGSSTAESCPQTKAAISEQVTEKFGGLKQLISTTNKVPRMQITQANSLPWSLRRETPLVLGEVVDMLNSLAFLKDALPPMEEELYECLNH